MLEKCLNRFGVAHPNTNLLHSQNRSTGSDLSSLNDRNINNDQSYFLEKKTALMNAIDRYPDAPGTLQRLCEIIMDAELYYKSARNVVFGLEKVLNVSICEAVLLHKQAYSHDSFTLSEISLPTCSGTEDVNEDFK